MAYAVHRYRRHLGWNLHSCVDHRPFGAFFHSLPCGEEQPRQTQMISII